MSWVIPKMVSSLVLPELLQQMKYEIAAFAFSAAIRLLHVPVMQEIKNLIPDKLLILLSKQRRFKEMEVSLPSSNDALQAMTTSFSRI